MASTGTVTLSNAALGNISSVSVKINGDNAERYISLNQQTGLLTFNSLDDGFRYTYVILLTFNDQRVASAIFSHGCGESTTTQGTTSTTSGTTTSTTTSSTTTTLEPTSSTTTSSTTTTLDPTTSTTTSSTTTTSTTTTTETPFIQLSISSQEYLTSNEACAALETTISIYRNNNGATITAGVGVFQESTLTNPYVPTNTSSWYLLQEGVTRYAVQIDSFGTISQLIAC